MKKYILLLLLAVCTQLSAQVLDKETLFKATAKLNGKEIPMWFNITADEAVEVGNGKNAAISQYAEGKLLVPANVVNPANNRSYMVTKVANFAFSLCSKLTEVTLEEGIKGIGEQAFVGCNSLTAIGYPPSIIAIGRGAFMGCKQLKHTFLPQKLRLIGQETFAENQFADNKMVLPEQITAIPLAAFQDCKLQVAVLSPALVSVEEDAFLRSGACDFYMFDKKIAPAVHAKAVSTASHWYATKPQSYDKESYCEGLLPISAMLPQDVFTTENITYKVKETGRYPGIFYATAYKKSDTKAWSSEFKDLKETVVSPAFPGRWKPEFCINAIEPTFFTGNDIVKLHHITLPASIESLPENVFAQCKALVSLDLTAMKPLNRTGMDAFLKGIPKNTIVYAPKGQMSERPLGIGEGDFLINELFQNNNTKASKRQGAQPRDYNIVLTNDNGQRHTRHFKLYLDDNFEALATEANLAYSLPYSFTAERATFYRTSFKNKQKETLVLPFTAKPQGKAYAFDGLKKQAGTEPIATFVKADVLLANTPYIYVSDGTEISAENVEVNPLVEAPNPTETANLHASYTAGFVKKLAAEQQLNGTVFAFNTNASTGYATFVQATDNTLITPFHAFFHVNDNTAGANLRLLLDGEETTGIQMPSHEAANQHDAWFNLQGVRFTSKPQKGVYIYKGKKVMVP